MKENNNPLVSVVMPAYNAEKYIGEAIDSILGQTYQNIELVIIDDASTDGTRSVLNKISDERVKLYYNDVNRGISYTTNSGIEKCLGEFIALMDDDDVATQNRIEEQVDFLNKHKEIDIVGGSLENIDEEGKHLSFDTATKTNPKYIKAMLLFCNWKFANATAMIRKSFLEESGLRFREGYLGMQDYQFYMECSKICKMSAIDSIVLKNRIHDKCTTKLVMDTKVEERKIKYKEIRRESLTRSGFKLCDQQYNTLDRILTEGKMHVDSIDDARNLLSVMKEIMMQAQKMEVDYTKEIEFVMKRLYTLALYNSNLFELI